MFGGGEEPVEVSGILADVPGGRWPLDPSRSTEEETASAGEVGFVGGGVGRCQSPVDRDGSC